jgi:hypothetical protein
VSGGAFRFLCEREAARVLLLWADRAKCDKERARLVRKARRSSMIAKALAGALIGAGA